MGYAITARYVGPTTYRGSRVIATGPALTHDGRPVRATVSWDYGASNGTGHSEFEVMARRAADAVVAKLRAADWHVSLAADDYGATLPTEDGSVFILHYDADR